MKCSKCGSRDIDFQESTGQSICMNCGTVLEESTIVSSIEFQESGERSQVIGQYVAANCTKPYMSGSRMMSRHAESRDTALINARRLISQLASSLRLPPIYIDRAYRLQEKSPFLLIDFSDILQINVYVLGRAFLQFASVLNINLPIVDPSLYIHRYASQFDFNEKQSSVITSSLRIITRLKKDWIVTGRRPDGVCAAALLIAARAHGFEIDHEAVAAMFRIANETVRRRLTEFKQTPAAQLNIVDFYSNESTVEYDPPAFIRNVLKESEEQIDLVLEEEDLSAPLDAKDLARDDVYARGSADDDIDDDDEEIPINPLGLGTQDRVRWDEAKRQKVLVTAVGGHNVKVPFPSLQNRRKPSLARQQERLALYDSIYSEVFESSSSSQQKRALQEEADKLEFDPTNVGGWGVRSQSNRTAGGKQVVVVSVGQKDKPPRKVDGATDGAQPAGNEGEEEEASDPVIPLTEAEAANLIYPEEERVKRAVIWQNTHGAFMEERARKRREREKNQVTDEGGGDKYTETGRLRKKYRKGGRGGASASEAVLQSAASVRGASKKINYDALKGMFGNDGAFSVQSGEGAPAPKVTAAQVPIRAPVIQPKEGAPSTSARTAAVEKSQPAVAIAKPSASTQQQQQPLQEEFVEDEDEDNLMYEEAEGDDQGYDYDDEYY
eukprot:scaffold659_cov192-Ochromonas_danica.AAC.81